MSSEAVSAAMAEAARESCPDAEIVEIPLADGGEGTLDVLLAATGAQLHRVPVKDPLGRPISAGFGQKGKLGIIETASACGLSLLAKDERNPLEASTYGVGEIIMAAYEAGCRRLLIGLGGSATCDGGAGMLSVPGVKAALKDMEVEILCDVDSPLTGPEGAARVFAPQKGASPEDVEMLEEKLSRMAEEMKEETGKDVSGLPGAGAAGGLGAALMAYSDATVVSGIGRIMDLSDFDDAVDGAALVITGEGHTDAQTLAGKLPLGVLRKAKVHDKDIRVALVSGRIDDGIEASLRDAGFTDICQATPDGVPVSKAINPENARKYIKKAIKRLLS